MTDIILSQIKAGNGIQLWISGTSYIIGQQVKSPVTFYTYTRKTNGAGTTEPSLDAANWASKTKRTKKINDSGADIGISTPTGIPIIGVASGAQTANVLTTMFSKSGVSGSMPHLNIAKADSTGRSIRCKVTVDGVVVYDKTSTVSPQAGYGLVVAGTASSSFATLMPPITWDNSILIEWASSNSETGGILGAYIYQEQE